MLLFGVDEVIFLVVLYVGMFVVGYWLVCLVIKLICLFKILFDVIVCIVDVLVGELFEQVVLFCIVFIGVDLLCDINLYLCVMVKLLIVLGVCYYFIIVCCSVEGLLE